MDSSELAGNKKMTTPIIKVFTSANCPFCGWAKKLLDKKQADYEEIRIDQNEEQMQEMVALAKRTSVPQIFIGDRHIGGYQDMVELDQAGDLDKLLGNADS